MKTPTTLRLAALAAFALSTLAGCNDSPTSSLVLPSSSSSGSSAQAPPAGAPLDKISDDGRDARYDAALPDAGQPPAPAAAPVAMPVVAPVVAPPAAGNGGAPASKVQDDGDGNSRFDR